jgi:hypothetical protein
VSLNAAGGYERFWACVLACCVFAHPLSLHAAGAAFCAVPQQNVNMGRALSSFHNICKPRMEIDLLLAFNECCDHALCCVNWFLMSL